MVQDQPPSCPICGCPALPELCDPAGIALCARCGHLFHRLQKHLVDTLFVRPERVCLHMSFIKDLASDSLDIVELIMRVEEDWGLKISDEEATRIDTVADLLRFIATHTRQEPREPEP